MNINKEEINYILESLKFKTSIYRDKHKRNLSFNDDEYYANILNEYIEDLQQRIDKAIEYIKTNEISSILEVHNGYEEEYTKPLLEILGGKE